MIDWLIEELTYENNNELVRKYIYDSLIIQQKKKKEKKKKKNLYAIYGIYDEK